MASTLRNASSPPQGFYLLDGSSGGAFVTGQGTPTIPDPDQDDTEDQFALGQAGNGSTSAGMA